MDDREAVAAIMAGDAAGLADAYDKYAAPLYGYTRWMLADPADAAEALQRTFVIAAATGLGGLRDPGQLRPWLYAVARDECYRRLHTAEPGLGQVTDVPSRPNALEATAAERRDAEVRRMIRATLAELKPREREIIELSLRHDLHDADLAMVLDVSWSRAHALAERARHQLEKALGVLVIARTGRKSCAALDELLTGWDGRLTGQARETIGQHVEQCGACTARTRGALRPEALFRLLPPPALPLGLRTPTLAMAAGAIPKTAGHPAIQDTRPDGLPVIPLVRPPIPPPVAQPVAPEPAAAAPSRLAGATGFLTWSRIRAHPAMASAVVGVVMWVMAAVVATAITFGHSHSAGTLAARTSGAPTPAASTPVTANNGDFPGDSPSPVPTPGGGPTVAGQLPTAAPPTSASPAQRATPTPSAWPSPSASASRSASASPSPTPTHIHLPSPSPSPSPTPTPTPTSSPTS
jgi:RNA polymerase sigma factor (sigma-70 family)